MVKGISRQVIVVHSPDQKLFDQAIFILKDDAVGKEGITDQMLLKSAEKLLHSQTYESKHRLYHYGAFWAGTGALTTALIWLLTTVF